MVFNQYYANQLIIYIYRNYNAKINKFAMSVHMISVKANQQIKYYNHNLVIVITVGSSTILEKINFSEYQNYSYKYMFATITRA